MTSALALGVVLAGCHGGPAAPPRVQLGEDLSVVIHSGREQPQPPRAHVDERRWLEVPARGELELGTVAELLELDSVVVESESDPDGLTSRSCRVTSARRALADTSWMWGQAIAVFLRDGSRVEGQVVDVGDPMAVVEDEEAETHALVPRESLRLDAERGPIDPRTDRDRPDRLRPIPGDWVMATDRDGREILGTFVAEVPERIVLRAAGGEVTSVPPTDVIRVGVAGVPSGDALRCEVVSKRPGRHLVRFSYSTRGMGWYATHRVRSLLDERGPRGPTSIRLEAAFGVVAFGMEGRTAHVQLILGLPGEADAPVTVWSGDTTLLSGVYGGGGSIDVIAPPVERRARVEHVYRGAEEDPAANPRRPEWRDSSISTVVRELAFERAAADAPGRVLVALPEAGAVHWVEGGIPAGAFVAGSAVRVPLAVEPDLVGYRHKVSRDMAGQLMVDEVSFSVANRGDSPVEVAVEEPLRGTVRPSIMFEKPAGELLRDRWRTRLTVPAGGIVQGQVVLQYRSKR